MSNAQLTLPDNTLAQALFGEQGQHLRLIGRHLGIKLSSRGNQVNLEGPEPQIRLAERVLNELYELLQAGYELHPQDVQYGIKILQDKESASVKDIFLDTVYISAMKRRITPKSLNQKLYIEAIRKHDLVFGIGPAGTGKTYLAMAMAVLAMRRKEVNRIILTRPAVEAGERLGFLPGTLFEKIDPYLRPLFDALHDMMDAEQIALHMERGTIEVAPLAFMRGRAQPVHSPVLTPTGWRPIGSLVPGDLVIGSDGWPTPVLGVYPQGARPVFRVTAQDGASTLCCAEHLWAVRTPEDLRRGKPARVLQTQELIGHLRSAHERRFMLPLLSGPAELVPQDVPMDAYAVGLLLGDGCMTTTADHVPNRTDRDGSVTTVDPATKVVRDLGLAGTTSSTTFVPAPYLYNAPEVRIALLQGLLDRDGAPVTQEGRACRIEYRTTSPRLRDDVVFLVRSLGGVACWRVRPAGRRGPRGANGRDVPQPRDAYVLDIRLPEAIPPFRLMRKADGYSRAGGGQPLRCIDRIEPEGEQETVCIQVAAADSLYVTDDFLLTHNTLNDSFIVLDEAQNTTPEQMKMFLTRLGFGSKVVVTGDVTQVDLPSGRHSGLRVVRNILTGIGGVEFCELTARDVVRHRIVQEIVEAYRVFDEEEGSPSEGGRSGRGQ
jgi:phosphate starvation-inducible protein PhoH and related proteins